MFGMKYKEKIELFAEKTGIVVRKIRLRNSIVFDEFLKDFRAMRYPGYNQRYMDKGEKGGKKMKNYFSDILIYFFYPT